MTGVLVVTLLLAVVASVCSAQTVLLTVGPHGTYPTIQGALVGVVSGGVNDVRIESGTFPENVTVDVQSVVFTSGELHFSGGWDATFSTQTPDPLLTVINGGGADRCVGVSLTNNANTTISLSNVTLTGGVATAGGGLGFFTDGRVSLVVSDSVITGNTSTVAVGSPHGGGVYADLSGLGSSLTIQDTSIDHNLVLDPGGSGTVRGGGAYIEVGDSAPVFIERVGFSSNQAEANTEINGAGLYLRVDDGALGQITDSRFVFNQAISSASPQVTGTGLDVLVFGGAWVRVRRNTLYLNDSQTGSGVQFYLSAYNTSDVVAGDIVVAGGEAGVLVGARDTARIDLTNFTVVDNIDYGLYFGLNDPTPTASVYNSIVYGNGTDLDLQPGAGTIATGNNLVGIDPVFANPLGFDYRLSAGSPAENAGSNSPPAELGEADCDGALRVIDASVDIGAYEGVDVLFSDGFALGTRRWSDATDG